MKSYKLLQLLSCLCIGAAASHAAVRVIVPPIYVEGTPVLVRVEVTDSAGVVRRNLWDAEAVLEVASPVVISTNKVVLRNGIGSRLIGFSGADAELSVTVNGESSTNLLVRRDLAQSVFASGTLTSNTTWSGLVRITNDVIVPAGITLNIEAGTMVLLEGISSTTNGVDLEVRGNVMANGTKEAPITFMARQTQANWNLNWGQIRHLSAAPSTYKYVHFSKAGRTRPQGHTGTGPMIRADDSNLSFEYCAFTDNVGTTATIGKVMVASDSELVLDHCLLTRSRMGPEIDGTSLLCTNTYFLDMSGPDDSDGIYLHNQRAGQEMLLTGCVVAYGEDDGIDTLSSTVTVTNTIIRNYANPAEDSKGMSIYSGRVDIQKCLVTDCLVGISAKGFNATPMMVTIDRSTIIGRDQAFGVTNKNQVVPEVQVFITNSILRAATPVFTDYDAEDVHITFSALSQEWPGEGNLADDPMFRDEAAHDYRLQSRSALINAGDPGSPADIDGSRADVGAFPFLQVVAPEAIAAITQEGHFQLLLPTPVIGRFIVQASTDLVSWDDVGVMDNSAEWTSTQPLSNQLFYRLISDL